LGKKGIDLQSHCSEPLVHARLLILELKTRPWSITESVAGDIFSGNGDIDKIVYLVDDPLIQLIIFLPSTLFVVTAVGVIIYCCHRSRQLRKTKNQKTYRVFSPRNFDSKDISEFGARINDERALPNVKSPRIVAWYISYVT